MLDNETAQLIKKLNLVPHPEGGHFKEIYRAKDIIKPSNARYNGEERSASTSIYYLLGGQDFSAWHRVNSDETWNFCSGTSLTLYIMGENNQLNKVKIGDPLVDEEAVYQYTVPNGLWFCAVPNNPDKYVLVTCNVSPGFEYKDWEMGDQEELEKQFPDHEDLIVKYTRTYEKPTEKLNKKPVCVLVN